MKRLLVVSPRFPPIDAAEMHRVRMSLPFFAEFGWQPHVLTVGADRQPDAVVDPLLSETIPPGVAVTRVAAAPLRWSRALGVGNVALRGWWPLYRGGLDLIRRQRIDLVYFSTTMFFALPLGRVWKRRLGVPYVIDLQDPWVTEYRGGAGPRGRKRALADRVHARLEPFTMRRVDGIIGVSAAYTETLRRRYPAIAEETCATIPFGASPGDLEVARRLAWRNPFFDRDDGRTHAVCVGRGGADMTTAAEILFRAAAPHMAAPPGGRLRMTFVGTDYAPAGQGRPTIAPVAEASGLGPDVLESTDRVPYFPALRLLADADLLIVLGSDDAQYSPSKIYPYLLARRPLVAVLHESSPVADLVRRSGAGIVATFRDSRSIDASAAQLSGELAALLRRLPFEPSADPSLLQPFTARELTRQQCALFDAVMAHQPSRGVVPCPA